MKNIAKLKKKSIYLFIFLKKNCAIYINEIESNDKISPKVFFSEMD
jgi:hypothetical protein